MNYRDRLLQKVAEIKQREAEKDNRLEELQERLSAAANRLGEIRSNVAYKLLPSWIREKIEDILGGDTL